MLRFRLLSGNQAKDNRSARLWFYSVCALHSSHSSSITFAEGTCTHFVDRLEEFAVKCSEHGPVKALLMTINFNGLVFLLFMVVIAVVVVGV